MKEKIVAALLAFFLGEWGIHKFYLNEQESGKKYLIWCVVGILTSWLLIGLIPLVVLCVKKLIDCFTILFMTDYEFDVKYNHIEEGKDERGILTD
jgi:TM2 domain-containing membrane protein YozV